MQDIRCNLPRHQCHCSDHRPGTSPLASGRSPRTSLRDHLSWPESCLLPATCSRYFAGAHSAPSSAVASNWSAGQHSWLLGIDHRRCRWSHLAVTSAKGESDSFHNCYVIVSRGRSPLRKKNKQKRKSKGIFSKKKNIKKEERSYLQTWPLWVCIDIGNGGASVIPSDAPGSLVDEGAGLMGCDAGPSIIDGLLSSCLILIGLGDLPCWLSSSGGGERAIRLG